MYKMRLKSLPTFINKSRRSETRENIPHEIVLPVKLTGIHKHPHGEPRVNKRLGILKRSQSNNKSGNIARIKRSTSDSTRELTISSNTQDDAVDGWSKYSLGCRRSRSVKHCLWKVASDSNGPMTRVDDLCRDQIVHMMSSNEAARKKLLDDMLNHGEF
mmetsp:Transcript_16256/g.35146  ORF Transcript_16256/g.35146 Transcript_16256/m.35146 type:complete len:159 (-) Transcript_16256:255-731(-)